MAEPAQGSVGSVAEDKAGEARPGSDRRGLPPGGLSIVVLADTPTPTPTHAHTAERVKGELLRYHRRCMVDVMVGDVQPSQQDYNAMVLRFR